MFEKDNEYALISFKSGKPNLLFSPNHSHKSCGGFFLSSAHCTGGEAPAALEAVLANERLRARLDATSGRINAKKQIRGKESGRGGYN